MTTKRGGKRVGSGRTAIFYGMWIATPFQHRWKKSARGYDVASALSDYAATL